MTPEEIAALVGKLVADALAAWDKAAADKAAAEKAAADKAAADKATGDTGDPAMNAALVEMRRAREEDRKKLEALEKAKQEADAKAEKAERDTALNTALADFAFRSPSAKQTAIQLLDQQVKRNDAGQLVAGDNLPVDAFAKDFIPSQHDYLLSPIETGGTGVNPSATVFAGQKAPDLNDIKAGMTAETRASVLAAMQRAMTDTGR